MPGRADRDMQPLVAMLVNNDLEHDSRVRKTATTLASHGYRVVVVGRAARGAEPSDTRLGGYALRLLAPENPLRDAYVSARREYGVSKKNLQRATRATRVATRRFQSRRSFSPRRIVAWRDLRSAFKRRDEAREELARALFEVCSQRERYASLKLAPMTACWVDAIAALRPDVIHVHDYHPLAAAVQAKTAWRIPFIYDAHEYLKGREESKLADGSSSIVATEKAFAPRADAVVATSRSIAQLLHAELQLATPPVVVYNAPSIHARQPPLTPLRVATRVPPHVPLVVYSGVANPRRGIDTLLRAIAHVPGAHLALISPAKTYLREIETLARESGVLDRVHFGPLVPLERIVPYLSDADVGAYTPVDDGVNRVALPNKLFEYLHAGLPIVTTEIGEICRFVSTTRTGETTDGTDEGTAAAIRAVLEDPGRYTRGRDTIARAWSWEAQEEKLLELYDGLMGAEAGLIHKPGVSR